MIVQQRQQRILSLVAISSFSADYLCLDLFVKLHFHDLSAQDKKADVDKPKSLPAQQQKVDGTQLEASWWIKRLI